MLALKGCTSVREPVNKDTGCGGGGGWGVVRVQIGDNVSSSGFMIVCSPSKTHTLTSAHHICSSET